MPQKKKSEERYPIQVEADRILEQYGMTQYVDEALYQTSIEIYDFLTRKKKVHKNIPMVVITFKGLDVSEQQKELGFDANTIGASMVMHKWLSNDKDFKVKSSTATQIVAIRNKDMSVKGRVLMIYVYPKAKE